MSVRNRVGIIELLRSVVVTVPQFYCSQFRLEFYQSILIHGLPWHTLLSSGATASPKQTFADGLPLEGVEPLTGRRPPTFRHRLPSLRLPLQIWQEESTLSTNRSRRRPQCLRMSTEQQQYSLDSQDAAIQSFFSFCPGSLVIMVITPVRTVVARSNGFAAPPALEHADRRSPQSSFSTLSRQHLTNEGGCVSVQNWTIPLPSCSPDGEVFRPPVPQHRWFLG